jgi:hypothetical protein
MSRSSVTWARLYRSTDGSGNRSSTGANGDIVTVKASSTALIASRTPPASASTLDPSSVSPAIVSVSRFISAEMSTVSSSRHRSAVLRACATIVAAYPAMRWR